MDTVTVPTTASSLVSLIGITKSYSGANALDRADLEIATGEIHGLVGENGAGKSTLIKILAGLVEPDSGTVTWESRPIALGSVSKSEAAEIAVVHQESTAFCDLGVEDNIFVGREPRRFLGLLLDRNSIRRSTEELLQTLDEKLPLDRPLREFSMAQQQMVAIARALSMKSRLVILDEPTASLSVKETEVLHRIIRQLKESGIGVLLVSHRLEEVLELCDRVTVLRDGRTIQTRPAVEWTRETLIQSMVGREIDESAVSDRGVMTNVVLRVRGLTRKGAFDDVSFEIRKGEILGLGGLVGSGRSEVAQAIFGIDQPDSGTVELDGVALSQGAINEGIALVPEDRQHQGLVLGLPVSTNIVMSVRDKLASWGWINQRREREVVDEMVSKMAVKAASPSVEARSLSGGNQQKVVIAKCLATKPRVLILDEPTRGVDVGSKSEIHKLVRQLARDGTAVLLVSSDLPELLSLSDRILVMNSGRIAGELSHDEKTSERVLDLAFGRVGGT